MEETIAHKELQALYGWSVSELAEFKGRQWLGTNSALLIYGALGALAFAGGLKDADRQAVFLVFGSLGLIVALFASRIVDRLDEAMDLRRARMREIRERHFTQEFRDAWTPKDSKGEDETVGMFKFVIWAGFLVLAGALVWKF